MRWILFAASLCLFFLWACAEQGTEPSSVNHAPTATAFPVQTVFVGDTGRVVLSNYFSDPDGDTLVYWAKSSSPDTLGVSVMHDTLLLVGVHWGHERVTVTAADASGSSVSQFVEVVVNVNQRAVLAALYHATDGPNWERSDNWLTDAPLDDWYGVLVGFDGQIQHLGLTWNGLSGPIPSSLADLHALEGLSLANNELSGPIPAELSDLAALERLNIAHNQLSGPIPSELGNLTRLRSLGLLDNRLSGSIPSELSNLTALERLDLAHNELSGSIPAELANLVGLERLRLDNNNLCAPDDPRLREWLIRREAYPYPCLADPSVRLLPSALMREDGNGLSLALPNGFRDASTVTISDPSVVAASVVGGWLELSPQGRGSAEVELALSGGKPRAVAVAVVRAAAGTFGIDIVMDQPAPLGYEEALTAAADWWSTALDGTEWPDREAKCGTQSATALADELLIQAGGLEPHSNIAAIAKTCFNRGSSQNVVYDPAGGRIEAVPFAAGDVDIMRHEIGHLLGLVAWARSTGLVTDDDGWHFVGARAVEVFRAGGGDPKLLGVPIEGGNHWLREAVQCELMTGTECGHERGLVLDEPDAISLAALADAGYTVDMSRVTPWPSAGIVQTYAESVSEPFFDHVVVEWVGEQRPPPR